MALTESAWFLAISYSAIVLNSIQIGLCSDGVLPEFACELFQHTFAVVYIAESCTKLYVLRLSYFDSAWDCSDLFLAVLGAFNAWVLPALAVPAYTQGLLALSLLRVLRATAERWWPPHDHLFGGGQGKAALSLFRSAALLSGAFLVVVYAYGIVCVRAFGGDVPGWEAGASYFGSLFESMFTLLSVALLADWHQVVRPLVEARPSSLIYFVAFVMTVFYGLFHAVLAAVTEAASGTVAGHDADGREQRERERKMALVLDAADKLFVTDIDGNDVLLCATERRLGQGAAYPDELLHNIDFPCDFKVGDLQQMFGHHGKLSKEGFVRGMARLIYSQDFQRDCAAQLSFGRLAALQEEVLAELRKCQVSPCFEKAAGTGEPREVVVGGGANDPLLQCAAPPKAEEHYEWGGPVQKELSVFAAPSTTYVGSDTTAASLTGRFQDGSSNGLKDLEKDEGAHLVQDSARSSTRQCSGDFPRSRSDVSEDSDAVLQRLRVEATKLQAEAAAQIGTMRKDLVEEILLSRTEVKELVKELGMDVQRLKESIRQGEVQGVGPEARRRAHGAPLSQREPKDISDEACLFKENLKQDVQVGTSDTGRSVATSVSAAVGASNGTISMVTATVSGEASHAELPEWQNEMEARRHHEALLERRREEIRSAFGHAGHETYEADAAEGEAVPDFAVLREVQKAQNELRELGMETREWQLYLVEEVCEELRRLWWWSSGGDHASFGSFSAGPGFEEDELVCETEPRVQHVPITAGVKRNCRRFNRLSPRSTNGSHQQLRGKHQELQMQQMQHLQQLQQQHQLRQQPQQDQRPQEPRPQPEKRVPRIPGFEFKLQQQASMSRSCPPKPANLPSNMTDKPPLSPYWKSQTYCYAASTPPSTTKPCRFLGATSPQASRPQSSPMHEFPKSDPLLSTNPAPVSPSPTGKVAGQSSGRRSTSGHSPRRVYRWARSLPRSGSHGSE